MKLKKTVIFLIIIFVVFIILGFLIISKQPAKNAESLLTKLYSSDINSLNQLPEDVNKLSAFYEKEYASYFTSDGYQQAISNRLFIKPAKYASEHQVTITVKKIEWEKNKPTTDVQNNKLYPYNYTVTCATDKSGKQTVSWTGTCYLTKEKSTWLIQRLDLAPLE